MNLIKTKKIIVLMVASYAALITAAADSDQQSVWQRAKDFAAQHPGVVGLAGTTLAVGVYELAAHKFGLPSFAGATCRLYKVINEHSKDELKSIESDTLGYTCLVALLVGGTALGTQTVLSVADSREGEYPVVVKQLCDAAVEHPVIAASVAGAIGMGLQLGYQEARANGLPPLYDSLLAAGKIFVAQVKKDLVSGAASPEFKPSVKDHIFHVARLCGYIHGVQLSFNLLRCLVSDDMEKTIDGLQDTIDNIPAGHILYIAPIGEEIIFRYVPEKFFKEKAQFFMPILFAAIHGQYDLLDQARTAGIGLIMHRSLRARPEYYYSPAIAHMLNNCYAYIVFLLISK